MKTNTGLLMALTLTLTGGCTSTTKQENMSPEWQIETKRRFEGAVSVTVANKMQNIDRDKPMVTVDSYRAALVEAVGKSAIFSGGVSKGGVYELRVDLMSQESPGFGYAMTAGVETQWTLTRKGETSPIFSKAFKRFHKATVNQAFSGLKRARLALEGASRATIIEGLGQISRLE